MNLKFKILLSCLFCCLVKAPLNAQTIDQLIKPSTRVVLVGDPTHGEGNVFEYRTKLFEKLILEHGFNVIGFESGVYFLNSSAVDSSSNINSQLKRNIFPIYSSAEQFQGTINLISKHKLGFMGFDFQYSSEDGNLSQLFDSTVYKNLSKGQKDKLKGVFYQIQNDLKVDEQSFTTFKQIVGLMKSQLSNSTNAKNTFQLHCLNNLVELNKIGYHTVTEANWKAKMSNIRDSMMAANVLWYLKQNPDKKLLLVGSSGHFIKNTQIFGSKEMAEYISMGKILKDSLEESLLSIATIGLAGSHGGYFEEDQSIELDKDSYENKLNMVKRDSTYFLSSSEIPKGICLTTVLDYEKYCGDWREAFNGFLVFNQYLPAEEVAPTVIKETYITVENGSKNPIKGVKIKKVGATQEADSTDSSGRFEIPFADFSDSIYQLSKKGYWPVYITFPYDADSIFFEKKVNNSIYLNHVNINTVTVLGKRNNAANLFKAILNRKVPNYATVSSVQSFIFESNGFINSKPEFKMKGTVFSNYPNGYLLKFRTLI